MDRFPTSKRCPIQKIWLGYKDQEQGEKDQLETAELVGTCDQECNTTKDQ
jgi:hypothetical protein